MTDVYFDDEIRGIVCAILRNTGDRCVICASPLDSKQNVELFLGNRKVQVSFCVGQLSLCCRHSTAHWDWVHT